MSAEDIEYMGNYKDQELRRNTNANDRKRNR